MSERELPKLGTNHKAEDYLGEGGMGAVFRGKDNVGNTIAIKVIHPELAGQEEFRERFLNEAKALNQLRHPNIVFLWGLFEEGETFYMVMDCVEGEDVSETILRMGLLPVEVALPVFRLTLDAIAFAHENGVIHRDIKPSNLLVCGRVAEGPPVLTEREDVKVMDFGIAKARYSKKLTKTGVIGTPEYMAPEMFSGSAGATEQSDVYALGVTLYEMVTGHVPFRSSSDTTAASIYQIANEKLSSDPPEPRKYYPPLDQGIEALILRAVARHPEDRFASVSQLMVATDAEIQRLGIEVPGTGAAEGESGPKVDDGVNPPPVPVQELQKRGRMSGGVAVGIWIGALVIGALVGTL